MNIKWGLGGGGGEDYRSSRGRGRGRGNKAANWIFRKPFLMTTTLPIQ